MNFDNRLLMTTQPNLDPNHGVWFKGLVALDYHKLTGMGDKKPPTWEGVWTGLRILRILTITIGTDIRCFAFALSDFGQIQLWELTKNRAFDRNDRDDQQIEWIIETRSMTMNRPTDWKRLMGAVQWLDRIQGIVSVIASYRSDESECWHSWATWQDCVEYRNCLPVNGCLPATSYRPQIRPFVGLPQPADVAESQTGGLTRDGYEFQIRLICSGRFRLKRLLVLAQLLQNPLYGRIDHVTCAPSETGGCESNACASIQCCDIDDYAYTLNAEDDPFPVYPTYPEVPPEYPTYPEVPPEYPTYPEVPPSTQLTRRCRQNLQSTTPTIRLCFQSQRSHAVAPLDGWRVDTFGDFILSRIQMPILHLSS